MARTKTKVEEVVDDEDLELEELDDDEETSAAPSRQEVTFGVADLARHLSSETGKEIKPRDLRTQIRRMARDGSGRVEREITAGNRTRYDWPNGLKDPEVKAIIKAVKGGELEAGKKEALDKLKRDKAARKDTETKTKTKKTKVKVEEPEEDEIEDIELEDEEE